MRHISDDFSWTFHQQTWISFGVHFSWFCWSFKGLSLSTYLKTVDFIFWKLLWELENYPFETLQKTLPIENTSRFWFKRLWKFCILEKIHFLRISQNHRISFASKSTGVDQVLTKIFKIDPKLTFNDFHILNHDYISKVEKNSCPFFFGGGGLSA